MMRRVRTLLFPALLAATIAVAYTQAADGFEVRKLAETSTTITFGWEPQPGDGYRFYANGVAVSRTFDPLRSSVRFGKGASSYRVEVLHVTAGASGSYPPPAPAPQPSGDVLPSGASWDAAYDAAPCGKTFLVDGSYPAQRLTGFKSCAGNPVRFIEAEGGRAVLAGLNILGASDVLIRGVELTYKGTAPGAGNQLGIFVGPTAGNDSPASGSKRVTLENVDAGSVSSWFATDLTVRGGDYGPCDALATGNVCGNNKQDVGTNVLIEGALFHDLEYDESNPDAHYECMYVNGGLNVTIRNNRYERCAIFDLFVTISGPDAGRIGHENLLIEGNYFGPATNGFGVESRGWSSLALSWCQNSAQPSYRNVLIDGNDFAAGKSGIEVDLNADGAGCRWENVRVEDNRGLMWQGRCQNGWLYARNEWVGAGSCG